MTLYQESLAIYMLAYRCELGTPENVIARIHGDIMEVMIPKWLKVSAGFVVRGGVECSITMDSREEELID